MIGSVGQRREVGGGDRARVDGARDQGTVTARITQPLEVEVEESFGQAATYREALAPD